MWPKYDKQCAHALQVQGQLACKSPEVIDAHFVVQLEHAAQALHPPSISILLVCLYSHGCPLDLWTAKQASYEAMVQQSHHWPLYSEPYSTGTSSLQQTRGAFMMLIQGGPFGNRGGAMRKK